MKRTVIVVLVLLAWEGGPVTSVGRASAKAQHRDLLTPLATPWNTLAFQPNVGQTDRRVSAVAHGAGVSVFLAGPDAVLRLTGAAPSGLSGQVAGGQVVRPSAVLTLHPVGGQTAVKPEFLGRLPGKVNIFHGANPRDWHTDIPTFLAVRFRNVYPGIDLTYHGSGGRLEYDWTLHPGANPSIIRTSIAGASRVAVDASGSLTIALGGVTLLQPAPISYQRVAGRTVTVGARYVLGRNRQIGLALGRYDRSQPLVVDPVVGYSTYLGGSDTDMGLAVAADSSGDVYVAGSTDSNNFPLVHAIRTNDGLDGDAFVTKLDPSGRGPIFSTFIGGSLADDAIAIVVDRSGAPIFTGTSLSDDYPAVHAGQAHNASRCSIGSEAVACDDAVITKLSASGDRIDFSTYLGGDGNDGGYGIALDHSGFIYVSGRTDSGNFPVVRALQRSIASRSCLDETGETVACTDGFVTKLDPSAHSLVYSTYLGGTSNDESTGIAVDGAGNAYVTGFTSSDDFPTAHAFGRRAGENGPDAWVAELNAAGSNLIYSTYLGGKLTDYATNIAVDSHGAAYVVGFTESKDFPTVNAFQSASHGLDAFVSRLHPGGQSLAYSTYLGGAKDDEALAVVALPNGKAVVVGDTNSTDFPTANAVQPTNHGKNDAFLTVLSASGSTLVQSTYLGGANADFGHAVAVDSARNIYVVGFTDSRNFPVTKPLQESPGRATDVFVTRVGNKVVRPKKKTLTRAPAP